MVTDDDRRRVAKELRDFFPIDLVSELTDVDCHLASMVMGDKFCPSNCLECFETVCERLADLIESSDAVKCVAEVKVDGEKLEKLVHDAVAECAGVDRDALLALADEMVASAGAYPKKGSTSPLLLRFARRIREALGVSE